MSNQQPAVLHVHTGPNYTGQFTDCCGNPRVSPTNNPPYTLPNQHGFQFIGQLFNGCEIRCEVVREPETGMHQAMSGGLPCFVLLESWRPGIENNTHMPTLAEVGYRVREDAETAWSGELQKAFGKRAGNARYTPAGQGEPGSALRVAAERWTAAMQLPGGVRLSTGEVTR
jgi:hypothetical protein